MTELKFELLNWTFKSNDETDWLPAKVPGCVHRDLYSNNKISDPFYGTNEKDLQWIDKKDWEYKTAFDAPSTLLEEKNIVLVFEGLDTYADVYLNGEKVLSADNMFRTWKVDIKPYLKDQNNILCVYFHSPIKLGLVKLEENEFGLPAINDDSEMGGVGDKKLSVYTRKAPYHFGWDWGPRFVTSGIWKSVYIEGWTGTRFDDLFIRQNHVTAERANLTAQIEVESDSNYEGKLVVSSNEYKFERTVHINQGVNRLELDIEIQSPKLWWSRGLGEPHQYEFTATLFKGQETVGELTRKTGIRSIKLIQDQDEKGTSFYFELNGIPVFAKGANHIPNDSFLTDITYERYKYEVQSAAEANMNMIRVWGGGVYEYDCFYELCDEYGILVWQDFMFACSMYPGDEAFLQNVRQEALDNIKRLRNHPSIALWCGNNEIDAAWSHYVEEGGWGYKQLYTQEQREKIWEDYEAVFHKILPDALNEQLPGANYWPSSPMSVWSGEQDQHALGIPSSGDIHYWGVWHNLEPFEFYNEKIGRFMSEYGFQSFPEERTVRTYAKDKDMALESDVMLAHQKNGRGNSIIKDYMDKYFRTPIDFPSFLYMSQVQQAEAIKSAIEAHRRAKPYCMGTLYWQLNDCWPVASWASIDYYGRWKALHYYAKKSFKDVMISIDGTTSEIKVYSVSDTLDAISGELTIQLIHLNGDVLKEWKESIQSKANDSEIIWSMSSEAILGDYTASETVLYVTLEKEGKIIDAKEHYFASPKEIALLPANITLTEVEGSNGSQFVLETDVLAKQVWVTSENEGIFSDNFFDLIPGRPYKISFFAANPDKLAFVPAQSGQLKVKSMVDFID